MASTYRQLTDTLILRTIQSEADIARLAAFNSIVHAETGVPGPGVGVWTTDLLTPGKHPTVVWDDFLVVEDTNTGEIISSLGVIPQTWTYAGAPFGMGRVELVGTHPDYRRRGLIRTLFEAIHERCAARDLPVQSVTGIPYFYRQFGYEFALELRRGKSIPLRTLPETPADTPFALRAWTADDLPNDLPRLKALYERFTRKMLVVCPRPDDHWHHRYLAQGPHSTAGQWLYIITREEAAVGYAVILGRAGGGYAFILELVLDAPYPEITPWLLPRLRDEAAALFADAVPPLSTLYFCLSGRHPIYPYLHKYSPTEHPPYAWYIRVPDLAAFIWQIRPALERRIARGPLTGLTRTLGLNFYTSGLRLTFESGKLVAAENLPHDLPPKETDAAFPPLVFLQLLFGYRSYQELKYAFPDVGSKPDARPIIEELFPRRPSWVEPLY